MPESKQPYRRRRPQINLQEMQEETISAEPHRIVVAQEDEPEWLVSSTRVSGAAERRGVAARAPQQEAERAPVRMRSQDKRTQESMASLNLKRQGQESGGEAEPAAEAGQEAPHTQSAPRAVRAPRREAEAAVAHSAAQRSERPAKKTVHAAKKPQARPAPRKLSKKARARRKAKIRNTVVGALCAVLLIGLLVGGVIGGSRLLDIKRTLDRGDNVFYPNIFVNNIPLEGKTLDEAAALVTQQVQSLVSQWRITLRTQDGRSWDITGNDLKMKYDVADQLDQLWAIGHTGSSSMRYEQVKALEEAPVMRYTTLTYDLSSVNQILAQIKGEIDQAPVSATRIYDEEKWPPYSYTDDVPGRQLDITGLNERICGMVDRLESGVVDLSPVAVDAPITRKYLESQIVQLASFETSIGKTGDYVEARHENIRIGTEKFDKLIIKSGESVSFNKVAGKRTASNGYQPALELAYGEYVEGYGGGICQVSSTLYNAVVNAGLEIRTRYQHSLPSSYVSLGLDATVQDDRLDFVFKNNTSGDIFISAEYFKGKNNYYRCRFTIHGRPDPNGYSYHLEPVVKQEIPIPEPTYIPDKNAQYVVYDNETHQTSKGELGYIVDVYLVTKDSKGLEVARELRYTDTYKAQTPKIYVGVTPRETPVPAVTPLH